MTKTNNFHHLKKIKLNNHNKQKHLLTTNSTTKNKTLYPKNTFTENQLKSKTIILHIIKIIYIFITLTIIYNKFFIPSLKIIITRYKISKNITDTTFITTKNNTPKFFTNLIKIFLTKNNIKIKTIIKSTIFNILFIIKIYTLINKNILQLT